MGPIYTQVKGQNDDFEKHLNLKITRQVKKKIK